ncbi:hypothetical protein F3Y22_tig00000340pilonHSYRG00617 [Hibiscus syriacus]|uniref:Uncharacterized protein n=1 Tax=Hibiscus syriacus TaxID=106335 RepID=A0A6A3D8I4_HIBSY|nr:hypothetical protein F3Y22_tig00000340pilonHSYRG00617 [Hibiscus syriacus]
MQFSRIGKLIVRFVELESIDVTVEPSFPVLMHACVYAIAMTESQLIKPIGTIQSNANVFLAPKSTSLPRNGLTNERFWFIIASTMAQPVPTTTSIITTRTQEENTREICRNLQHLYIRIILRNVSDKTIFTCQPLHSCKKQLKWDLREATLQSITVSYFGLMSFDDSNPNDDHNKNGGYYKLFNPNEFGEFNSSCIGRVELELEVMMNANEVKRA